MEEKPFIYLFKTRNRCYCYDVNTSSVIRITEKDFNILKYNIAEQTEGLRQLRQKGYLQSYDDSIVIEHPATNDVTLYLEEGMKQLILQLTQNCNLRCKYCVYSGSYKNRIHTNKRMTLDTAKKAIDFYCMHSQAVETARIGLYGGEPLLEFDMIKEIVAYAEKLFKGKELRFNLTTNATLLNEEMICFLQKHSFDLMISLDGPKNVQDRGRVFADGNKGTFDTVMKKIDMIHNSFPKYMEKISFNAVLDTENDFACSSDFFTYDFLKTAIVTSTTVSDRDAVQDILPRENFYVNYQYELFKGFLSCVGRIDKIFVSKLVLSHKGLLINSIHERISGTYKRNGKCNPNGPCIAGSNRLFVTVDGEFYPCERVSETNSVFNIGDLEKGFDVDKVITLLNTGRLTEEDCKKCWAINLCNLCAADFGEENELSADKKRKKCVFAKREAEVLLNEYCTLREYGYNFEG